MSNQVKVEFIDTSKECIDLMRKYAKDGLKAGGKVITNILKEEIPVRTGGLKKAIVAWAKIDYKTGQPYMEIGYRSRAQMKKRGIKYYVNPWWLEVGIKPHTIATKEYVNTGKSSYELKDHTGKKYGVIVRHGGVVGRNLLRNTVQNNITEINEAQKEHLGKITELKISKGMTIDIGGDEEID